MPLLFFFIYLSYDGNVDMQILDFLTKSQCRVSDTQVTVKARGPFVKNIFSAAVLPVKFSIHNLKTLNCEILKIIVFIHLS